MTGGRDELSQLLRRAGLEILEWRIENVLSPSAAWRPVIAGDTQPTATVGGELPDLVAQINAQWHRLAAKHKVMDDDGAFLIDVAGPWTGCGPRRWTRVRLTDQWDLAGVLGDRPGQPEFVTLSTNGDVLLGATSEEYEVWLVAVDRVKERQEEAARAAAEEATEDREAAWASLFRIPGPPGTLCEMWAHGLARNLAVPDDVQEGLLGLSYHLLWRSLPTAIVDAAIDHPAWKVRGLLAEAQPNITAEQWTRLILGETDPRHRWILTTIAADRRARLTETAYDQLTADPAVRIREEAARLSGLPAKMRIALALDPDPAVRASACPHAWSYLDGSARQRLLTDPDATVRAVALLQHHQDHPLPRSTFDSGDLGDRAVETCRLEYDLADHLAHHGDEPRRRSLAGNPHLAPDLVAVLARDPDASVRFVISIRPELTEEQRADVRVDHDPNAMSHALDWVTALHDDPDAMRRLAASSHPLVRRSVARAKHLPPEAVELLARDEDRVVRLFLAESCDDAPADMLLEVWQWWTGSLSHPDRPRSHPNFPRQGLLRHADDPNPRMRQLALDDPESPTELVERFSRDAHAEVRRRAAKDSRLSAASAVRLLDDSDEQVRRMAIRHPRLPARILVRLLRDADTAQEAAQHPGLPSDVMRRMAQRVQPGTGALMKP
ncbi:PE-PGRS family protein [Streptomyces sp. Rer75]|uniref:PE-PGRS family protein n=1 Tax=Streptomyces sp. Rer75 TaxID=2750011 RepID=UPI0015D01F03|nr:PE-PGRS family protein [Streptomyces sp. Rer75]QLH24638.1 PE-PGRS family protein [Streptomyces sp. Rer75]